MSFFYENRTSDFFFRNKPDGGALQFSSHLHYHIELVYMRKGQTKVLLNAESFMLEDDSIFVAFPNQIHGYESYAPESYQLLILNPDVLPELGNITGDRIPSCPILHHVSDHPDLLALLEMIRAEYAGSPSPLINSALRGLLLTFFSKLFRLMSFNGQKGNDSRAIRAIIEFCTQNYHRELSLELLSRELHISKYYISHLFCDRLGIRFNDYINFWRVSAACRHLSENVLSITQISTAVGFGTIRTFNRAFIKQMGISPSEYRRNHLSSAPTEWMQNTLALSASAILSALSSNCYTVTVENCIPSTNLALKNIALSGAAHGTVLLADCQTEGRGRLGRSFYSPGKSGLYMSVLLRPNLPLSVAAGRVTTMAAVAVARAITRISGLNVQIKWVNDLLLKNKKVCGILAEAVSIGEENAIILGIGINVGKCTFPPELIHIATTLYANGKKVDRNLLAAAVLDELAALDPARPQEYMPEYRALSATRGKEIRVLPHSGEPYDALALDITDDGALLVEKNGQTVCVSSGEVSIRNTPDHQP